MSQAAVIEELNNEQLKKDIPEFRIGDTIEVHIRIIEGSKERTQVFTGTVIARRGRDISETVSLYRVSHGCGMERVFMLHSPRIAKIKVVRSGKVRRSKLYNLRGSFGKAAKVKEKIYTKGKTEAKAEPKPAPVEEKPQTPPEEQK